MCGIAGHLGSAPVSEEQIRRCLALMARRGPDFAACSVEALPNSRRVILLHSRLAIIDKDPRANQPFHHGNKTLVCNGELYNYLELRHRLADLGEEFVTESDTEVLVHVLDRLGEEGLDACEGMWAFALYDREERTLLLCRDRFGEKPLYLFRDETGLFFGSEIKFIAALRGRWPEVNHRHLYRYLVNGYKSLYKTAETFFVGIEELPAATVLRVDHEGGEQAHRYWQPSYSQDPAMSWDDAVAGVRERVIQSMRLRLRADVPLAFCMSGGVDSNTLISVARRVLGHEVHGFTLVNEDARYEEAAEVAAAVAELEIRHTSVPITSSGFRQNLAVLVRQHDAPVFTISYYIHWLLMRQIHDAGYRISVSGTAADELLTGYYDHHNLYLHDVRDTEIYTRSLEAWQRHVQPYVRNPYLKRSDLYLENPGCRDHIYLGHDRFATFLKSGFEEEFRERAYTTELLRNRMLNELFAEAVPVILHDDDANAMYFSIENRSPFLDRQLFEFCCRIPSRHLIRDGYAKAVLREAMREIVPAPVLWNHRKVGFNAPVRSFVDVADPTTRDWMLDQSPVFEHVRREKIEELIGREELLNSESKFLFYFVNMKVFLEEFRA